MIYFIFKNQVDVRHCPKWLAIGMGFLLLFNAAPIDGHTGNLAIALPISNITIDGHLNEWPDDLRWYDITHLESGDTLTSPSDFHGQFCVAYNLNENTLYFALKVQDDAPDSIADHRLRDLITLYPQKISAVDTTDQYAEYFQNKRPPADHLQKDMTETYNWEDLAQALPLNRGTQDGCEIYLNISDTQYNDGWINPDFSWDGQDRAWYRIHGYNRKFTWRVWAKVDAQWHTNGYQYEGRIYFDQKKDLQLLLKSGTIMGFDIAVWDQDADGTRSRFTWGTGANKETFSTSLGSLVLAEPESLLNIFEKFVQQILPQRINNARQSSAYQMGLSSVLLAFSLLHVLLFAFYPRAKETLYFAFFTSLLAATFYTGLNHYASGIGTYFFKFQNLPWVLGLLVFPSGLLVLRSMFYPFVHKYVWVLLALSVLYPVLDILEPNLDALQIGLWVGVVIISFFDMLRIIIVAIYKKKRGAIIVGLGFLSLLVYPIAIGTLNLTVSTPQMNQYMLIALLSFILCMSIHLARNVGHTNTNLENRLIEVQDLTAKTIAQERALREEAEKELQAAHDMQMGLMPSDHPTIEGYEISGRCIPAAQVGGDFYQYYEMQNGRLALALADVTGHAMEAAIPVVMFSGILGSQVELESNLENLFGRLNRSLYRSLDNRTFVCFSMGELDPMARVLKVADSGCPYPYHFRATTQDIVELQVDAYPLGVQPDTVFDTIEVSLQQGDYVIFCSDGIVEADNAQGEQLGFEKTAETIRAACVAGLSAEAVINQLIETVQNFKANAPQSDDMTCMVLRVT